MGVRRQAREAALQALFMCDFIGDWSVDAVNFCFDHFAIPKGIRPFATQLAEGTIASIHKIDSKLTCASEHWSLTRMGRVDRSILRVASYEIMFLEEIPVNVAINEAIEIAKRFGSEESPQFINGVLDRVASLERPKADRPVKLKVEVIREDSLFEEERLVSESALLDESHAEEGMLEE